MPLGDAPRRRPDRRLLGPGGGSGPTWPALGRYQHVCSRLCGVAWGDASHAWLERHPDGTKWVDTDHFATANEGDWKGGSRSFSIFKKDGTLVYDSGPSLVHAIAEMSPYPAHRSHSKRAELDTVETAIFIGKPMLFVASERALEIGVYDIADPAALVLKQLLSSGGAALKASLRFRSAIFWPRPMRSTYGVDGLAPTHVMIYELAEGTAAYPMTTSVRSAAPIGWGALSAPAADPEVAGQLYAISESFCGAQPRLFTLDATQKPLRIADAITATRCGDAA